MANDPVKPRTKILQNGAVYDLDKGRIDANPGGGSKAITTETSGAYHARRQEKRRETIAAAANAAVEREDYRLKYGDLAYVAAIAETALIKATTPDDPKAIDAARFLLQETGMSEKQQLQQQTGDSLAMEVGSLFVEYVRRTLSGTDIPISDTMRLNADSIAQDQAEDGSIIDSTAGDMDEDEGSE